MENVFSSLTSYGSWNVESSRNFNENEISAVKSATVVESQFGKSVSFLMVTGDRRFIPLGRNSEGLSVGTQIDMKTAKLLTLSKPGSANIIRVEA